MAGPTDLSGVLGTQTPDISFVPDSTQRFPLGTLIPFMDPYYGLQEMVYAQAAGTQETGSVVFFATGWQATDIPNTANLGRALAVSKTVMASGSYGWYVTKGVAPWSATASVAAGTAFGITAAGQVGANTAGKQILGATVQIAGTGTFTKTGVTNTGAQTKRRLQLPNVDGIVIGLAVSGTGIAGGTTVAGVDSSGNFITLSADMTAIGTVTITFTYTNFLVVYAQDPIAQGAIT